MRTYDVRNRLAHVFFYRGCQEAVDDLVGVWPDRLQRHTGDLSAVIDVAGVNYEEVGTFRK